MRHVRGRNLREPHAVNETVYWSDHPDPAQAIIKEVYNWRKNRKETWQRRDVSHEWILWNVTPGRHWEESFVGAIHAFAGIVGLSLNFGWSLNGDPAPAVGNYDASNEIGGGLDLIGLGAAVDDWIAIHWGDNYPTMLRYSPHFKLSHEFEDTAGMYALLGLVSANNLETGDNNPWTVPDDGIWIEYDTDIDNQLHFVTRSGGTSTQTPLGTLPLVRRHRSIVFQVNDDYDQVKAILLGHVAGIHTTNLPGASVQLKPLFMVGSKAGGGVTKEIHLHDFRLIMDRGFY